MEFTLYLDECGDHGLNKVDPDFPVFVLCGILFSEAGYKRIVADISAIKYRFCDTSDVILHSRDIRKCQKEFSILANPETKEKFYSDINTCFLQNRYRVLAAVINKEKHVGVYGSVAHDPYEIALSFIIERTIFLLDELQCRQKTLKIVIEKRGKKEDRQLASHFETILASGTRFVHHQRIKNYSPQIEFYSKRDNITGLQVADLIAYPIAHHVMNPTKTNPAFTIIEDKIYQKNGRKYGLKIFP